MTNNQPNQAGTENASTDVFAAARWFGSLWNSTAKAVSLDEVEWQCNTWGSGDGRGDWLDTASFRVAAAALGLALSQNWDGRDELIVSVPFDQFPQVAGLLDRLGEEAEAWPWFAEDEPERQIAIAAQTLGSRPLRWRPTAPCWKPSASTEAGAVRPLGGRLGWVWGARWS